MSNDLILSCEFFPPKTEKGVENLRRTREELAIIKPAYYSVTYGAGGSTRDGTISTIKDIHENDNVSAVPHLTCIGSSKDELQQLLEEYQEMGIKRLVTLRGDLPDGGQTQGAFTHTDELVEFIRQTTGDFFTLEVAAYPEVHPESATASSDMENFKRKVDAGADGAITQYFFNIDGYIHFLERAAIAGIDIPIVPGIMPITNFKNLKRFSDMCGAEIPRWIEKQMEDFGDDLNSVQALGNDIVTNLCEQLIAIGVPGIHFYSMNQSASVLEICANLNLKGQ